MGQVAQLRRPWLFYGRARNPGHYLWTERLAEAVDPRGQHPHPLSLFHRLLCAPFASAYTATLTRLGGHGYTALAWWEADGEDVHGGNCILFGPDLRLSPATMLRGFERRFPSIASRMPYLDINEAELQHAQEEHHLSATEIQALI